MTHDQSRQPLNLSNPHSGDFSTEFKSALTEHSSASVSVGAADWNDLVSRETVAKTLVATEIIAASLGRSAEDFTKDLPSVAGPKSPKFDGFKMLAIAAVAAVVGSVRSKLQVLFHVEKFLV